MPPWARTSSSVRGGGETPPQRGLGTGERTQSPCPEGGTQVTRGFCAPPARADGRAQEEAHTSSSWGPFLPLSWELPPGQGWRLEQMGTNMPCSERAGVLPKATQLGGPSVEGSQGSHETHYPCGVSGQKRVPTGTRREAKPVLPAPGQHPWAAQGWSWKDPLADNPHPLAPGHLP